jgi:hypothetical protein
MTDTSRRRIRSIGPTLVAMAWACLLMRPVSAQIDLPASERAVSALGQFQRDVQSMRSVVNTPLGPYPIRIQCSWCSKTFIWCIQTTTRTYSWDVDFNWTRNRLKNALNEAEGNASAFSGSYAPTQAWLKGLPAFNTQFASAADVVLAVQAEIKAGNGSTDAQRQRVTQALGTLVSDLTNSSQLLSNGTRALTAYLQRQSSNRDYIKTAIEGADQDLRAALASYQNGTATWSPEDCRKRGQERFNQINRDFSASTQQISQIFQTLDGTSREAEKALAAMVGTLVSSQSDYQSILDQIKAAQNDQLGSFLEKLHLSSAKNQWKQLADYAARNL